MTPPKAVLSTRLPAESFFWNRHHASPLKIAADCLHEVRSNWEALLNLLRLSLVRLWAAKATAERIVSAAGTVTLIW
jgi:hypothetical protein